MPHLSTITLPNNVTYDIDTTYTAGDGLEITGDDNTISVKFGSTANTACEGNDSRLSDARPASDVYPWAKEPTKPTYTASEVGAVASTEKGSNNGVAELDANGKVPSSQLPSFVDDIIEGYYYNGAFYEDSAHTIQITPESGKIYTDLTTNKIYRWGGSAYVETSQGVVLGETSETAYRGDRGKIAYDHAVDPNRATTSVTSGFYKIAHTSEGHIQSTTPVVKSDITNLGIPGEEQIIEKTRAEYDQLTPAEKNNGKYYHITDEDGNFALDKYVRQMPSTDNTDFEVLLSGNGGNTDITTYSKKTDGLTFNPSTNILTTKGDIVASGYTWDGTNTSLQTTIGSINTSLSNKQDTITGGATTITSSNLTASRVLVSNSSGKVAVSSVTSSDLTTIKGYKHISRIANVNIDIGSIGANTSGSGTATVAAAASGETVYFLYRASTWCIPQSVSLSNTTLTVVAINPSANSHNCAVSYVLVYVK